MCALRVFVVEGPFDWCILVLVPSCILPYCYSYSFLPSKDVSFTAPLPSLKSDTKSLLTLLLPLTNSGAISLPSKIVDSCPSFETLHLLKILLTVWLISLYREDGVGVSKGAWSMDDGRLPGEVGGLLQTIVDGSPCLLLGIYKAGTYLDIW